MSEFSNRVPRVAAVVTSYWPGSHADLVVGRIVEGRLPDGDPNAPRLRVASMYVDQFPENDLARDLAQRHGIPIFPGIGEALTLGGSELAVDGVLLIGEHGEYPANERGQKLYPRRRFFVEAREVMERSGRVVPTFTDKHLSWSWEEIEATWRDARRLGIPLMAGSSLPITWRDPPLVLPVGCEIEEAFVVGRPSTYQRLESYDIHALETLQCMVERRRGGETGVASVRYLRGQAVWEAASTGAWSAELQEAAVERTRPRRWSGPGRECPDPSAYRIEYRDGLRATVLMLDDSEFAFAARLGSGEVVSTRFILSTYTFQLLVDRLDDFVLTGRPPYPVERTVLTSGMLSFLMESRFRLGERVETPALSISYRVDVPAVGARSGGTRPH